MIDILAKAGVDEQDGSEYWRSQVNQYLSFVYDDVSQLPPVVRENSQDVPDTNVGNIDYISRQEV